MKWEKYQDTRAWQVAMELVDMVYSETSKFPADERYGLTSQMRRAAVSIPSNIAEGVARKGNKQLMMFLSYSLGSLAELETQVNISKRQKFMPENNATLHKIIECKKIIYGMIRSLKLEP